MKALSAFPAARQPTHTLAPLRVTEWLRNERDVRDNSAKTLEKKGTLVGAVSPPPGTDGCRATPSPAWTTLAEHEDGFVERQLLDRKRTAIAVVRDLPGC